MATSSQPPLLRNHRGIVAALTNDILARMDVPDFNSIAERIAEDTGVGRLEEWDHDDPERVVTAIAEQLCLIWNARGAADIAYLDTTLSSLMGVTKAGPYVKILDRTLRALDAPK